MKASRIEIPALQNWSCHGCTDCCRGQLLITLSAAEKERIEKQGWTTAEGVDPATMIVAQGDAFRLGHQSDGACVFLDPSGRCRIHAKFGEAAKPLACRLYPLAIHPAGKKVVIGLRFSCPSAAMNRGKPLEEQRADIQKLAALVVPANHGEIPPPAVAAEPGIEWPDFLRYIQWLDVCLATTDASIALKLIRALHCLRAAERGGLDQVTGESANEILEALVKSAAQKLPALPENEPTPGGIARLLLRLLVLENARTISIKDLNAPGAHRWKMLMAALRFGRASGRTPDLRKGLASVKFAEIEKSFGPLPPSADDLLTRFFRMKIQSLHFCGRAFHDRPLIEGFRNLALLYPTIIWLSRWLAVSDGRTRLTDADVAGAVSMVDYHHGYSPYLSWRVRLLDQRNEIIRLINWYAR
jgi:lysine-N-methylase